MHLVHMDTSPHIHPTDQKGEFMTRGPVVNTAIQVVFMLHWCTSHGAGTSQEQRRTPGGGTNPHTVDLSNSTTSSQLLKSITYNTNKSKWPGNLRDCILIHHTIASFSLMQYITKPAQKLTLVNNIMDR